MLADILFSLDRVMPYFFLIVLGSLLGGFGLVSRPFLAEANRFTFKVALPAQLFCSILDIEQPGGSEGRFMAYVFTVTLVSYILIWLITEFLYKDKTMIGTLVQGGFRSNYLLLGVPLAASVLGPQAVATAAIASIVIIPAYNILAVIVLAARSKSMQRPTAAKVLRDIITNPLIIGICVALPLMLLKVKLPLMLDSTLRYMGQTGTPLGLLSIGGLLNLEDATARLRPALYSTLIKNVLLPVAVMAVSIPLGFRGEELLVLFVMSASPVAISSYAMATQMGGDPPLASNIMILSTFLSGFTLAAGIYFLRALLLI